MIVSAHIGGVPVEEMIPAAAGAGGALCLARAWVFMHLRRARTRGALPQWSDDQ